MGKSSLEIVAYVTTYNEQRFMQNHLKTYLPIK